MWRFLTLLLLSGCMCVCQVAAKKPGITSYSKELKKAAVLYKKGDKEEARKLYQIAADKGSAEAHFQLAYSYVISEKDAIYHYSEAAKQGLKKALDRALDRLFFRANSLELADPKRALDLYYQAKKVNPSIKLFNEEEIVQTLQMSVEAGEFDAAAFIQKYNIIIPKQGNDFYYVWELAEEASKGGRFGKHDPKLVLQLVSRGGFVPSELMGAVRVCYDNWKANKVEEFKIDRFITSGFGFAYVKNREAEKKKKEQQEKLDVIVKTLVPENVELLRKSYDSAKKFIVLKVQSSEIFDKDEGGVYYGGSLEGDSITECITRQMTQYTEMLENIFKGFTPSLKTSYTDADQKLNEVYLQLRKALKNKPKDANEHPITLKKMQDIQLAWIKHRDMSARLFSILNPKLSETEWKTYLTEIRVEQLGKLYNDSVVQKWVNGK
jgi:uncharacterized protein YecT (DUF1311 family)